MTRPPLRGTSIRLPLPLVESLRAAAEAEGKTVSTVLREAAEAWLTARGRWPPKIGDQI